MTGTVHPIYSTKAVVIQFVMSLVANTALLSSGMTLGFSAIALPFMLEEENSILFVTESQASWIASLATIATAVGCLISGPIIDKYGRKKGLLSLNIPAFIGWLFVCISPSFVTLCIGRVLTGIAWGLSSIPATVYITESSTASLRGLLVVGTSTSISLGVLVVYILGLFIKENWPLVAGICSVIPVISGILIGTILPESPAWLISKGKLEDATSSLKFLRGTDAVADIQVELDDMVSKAKSSQSKSQSLFSNIKAMGRPEGYKPLIILNLFFFFQQMTGIFVVIFYAVDVVREAGVKTDPFVVTVMIGLIRLVFTVVSAWMSRRFGRRPTAIISGVGMTVSLITLASFLYSRATPTYDHLFEHPLENNFTSIENENTTLPFENKTEPSLVPLISILIYILSSTLGFLTLPWAMNGEIFPSKIRGVAAGLTTCITFLVSFVAVKIYPSMLESLNKHGVFFFYGAMALLGTIFVAIWLPETQGKTLGEIEDLFRGKRKRNKEAEGDEEGLHSTKMITIVSSNK